MLGANYYARMLRGLRAVLRTPPGQDARESILEQWRDRDERFLETLRRVIFARRDHPYAAMFRLAGCEWGDLVAATHADGLDRALAALQRAGVFLAHDEFKGKCVIVRGGHEIPARTEDFANPLVDVAVEGTTGGSRSAAVASRVSAAAWMHWDAYRRLAARDYGVSGNPFIALRPILPSSIGLTDCLNRLREGTPVDGWFSPAGASADSLHYRTATAAMIALCRMHGHRVPFPSFLPPDDFSRVAERIARHRRAGRDCTVGCFVSPATRVAAAALERGLDISGTTFMVGGETLTQAKARLIASTGARVATRYRISEIGPVGYACHRMFGCNDVHLFEDSIAIVESRRRAPYSDVEVNSLLLTTLHPAAPFILINADMEDQGTIEPADCDCVFSALGFRRRIRNLSSFGKLTGQGMTLLGTDIVHILEEALPARFGGSVADYQLVEVEGAAQTQLELRVSPRVGAIAPEEVRRFFFGKLRECSGGALASRVWQSSRALQIAVAEPFSTPSGKVLALHLLGAGRPF